MAYKNERRQKDDNKKKTGAKGGVGKNGKPYVRGWNYSRRYGMVTFFCFPYDGTSRHDGKSQEWENWMCKIKQGFTTTLKPCLYSVTTRKVTIPELGIVINPSAAHGGYCGRFSK